MHLLETELEQRWRSMFFALAAGDDVPPAVRLRTEGMMEAVELQGIASRVEMLRAMDRCYREAFGHGLADDFGEDWEAFFPFPEIPAMMVRAPVYPSTRD